MSRIALVTPWFGRELIGGAERLAWDLAHALAGCGAAVEVLTTCARSFADDWGTNYHRAGTSREGDLAVRRFKVDSRDRVAFARAVNALLSTPRVSLHRDVSPVDETIARAYVEHTIGSRALCAHLQAHGDGYDAVLFVPYLYGTTLAALPIVGDRAFLIPCLHDEPYAYLDAVREAFGRARGLLFNSDGERDVAAALYGPAVFAKSRVIGHAVDAVQPPASPVLLNGFAPHRSRYLLYLGRQDRTKNIEFLCEAFARFRDSRRATALQLVLAGPRTGERRVQDGVVDLGAVHGDVKAALLTCARAVVQPSVNESFSRAIYESWFARRPVVVHADCRATAHAVEETGGGWIGGDVEEWARIFALIDESGDEAIDAVGRHGCAAALENGDWGQVAGRALDAVARFGGEVEPPAERVDQFVPLGRPAAAAYAAALDAALRRGGADATVAIAGATPPRPRSFTIVHREGEGPVPRADAVVVHQPGADGVEGCARVFVPSLAILDALAQRGRLARLLPPVVDPAEWSGVRPRVTWDDGRLNVLALGACGLEEVQLLVETLVALVAGGADARLLLAGARLSPDACGALERDRVELDLHERIVFAGDDAPARYAALRAAHVVYVPGEADARELVTPLWFDVPVVAQSAPLALEIVEPCGLILDTRSPGEVAAILRLVATSRPLRAAILAEARRVRDRHAPWNVLPALFEQRDALGAAHEIRAQ